MVRARVKQITDRKFAQLPSFLKRRDQKYYRAGHGPSPVPNISARKIVLISTEGERDNRTGIKTGTGPRSQNQRAVAFLNKGVWGVLYFQIKFYVRFSACLESL